MLSALRKYVCWILTVLSQRVQQAISSILDVTAEVARTGLKLVGEAGEILPVPGLSLAAKLLEQIWDAIEKVDVRRNLDFYGETDANPAPQSNRLACLRLSERCAEILLAIYEEIHSSGPVVVKELQQPLHHLQEYVLKSCVFQFFRLRYLQIISEDLAFCAKTQFPAVLEALSQTGGNLGSYR